MKHIIAPRIMTGVPAPADVSRLMDEAGLALETIDTVNWEAYPYRPEVRFRIAHTGTAILLHYMVSEATTRAVYGDDLGKVWTDSCVEFFSSPSDDGMYYNLETNCIGTVLLCCGKTREGRQPAPADVLASIGRHATLGRRPFGEKAVGPWQLSLVVPASAWFNHHITDLGGMEIGANFYKCGDDMQQPHFLSWNPIGTATPDFHRPDYFGRVTFGK